MAWQASRREKLLIYGGYKVGKSLTYVGLMDFARMTKTDSHFFIIDNDNSCEAIGLYPGGTYGELLGKTIKVADDQSYKRFSQATIWIPRSFDAYGAIVDEIDQRARPQDWNVLDMASNVWGQMPDWWINNVYGDTSWGYYARVRKGIENEDKEAMGRGFGGQSGVDWEYIGKSYRAWERRITTNSPCHHISLSSETEIQERYDKSGEQAKKYASTSGFAPKTEKDMSHRVHTIMRMTKAFGRDGKTVIERDLTLLGDRDREERWAELAPKTLTIPVSKGPRFAWDYLVKFGWKPGGG
jgi:hypothetical protein